MFMEKLTLSFTRLPDADFGMKAEAIVAAVAQQTIFFPTPIPALALITDAIGVYLESLIAAKSLDKTAVAIKNQRRAELTTLLIQLAMYVMQVANGDRTILVSSGFELAKTKEPAPPLVKPENFQVIEGINTGELLMKVKRQRYAKSYQFQVTTTDPSISESAPVWISQLSSSSKIYFRGLEGGKRYWCRVGLTGSYNQQVFSNVITKVVQ
jgi:hypothetical protein